LWPPRQRCAGASLPIFEKELMKMKTSLLALLAMGGVTATGSLGMDQRAQYQGQM
jgi:hypothetical protein